MLKRILLASLLLASLPALADTKPDQVQAQKFTIDTKHTQVSFTYDHFGFSHPTARLEQINGALELDQKDWSKSSVNVTMPLTGLHTGVEALDKHIKSADFLDA